MATRRTTILDQSLEVVDESERRSVFAGGIKGGVETFE